MKLSRLLFFIILFIAVIMLSLSLLMEEVFVYSRNSFLQWFTFGFGIVGCGGVAIYLFLLYSTYRKRILDDFNVFIVSFLLFLSDFHNNLSDRENFNDSLERLKKISEDKARFLKDGKNFMLAFTSFPRTIRKFAGFVDEYVDVHNKAVPQIVRTSNPNEKEYLMSYALQTVNDIARRAYFCAKKYASRRGKSGIHFSDFQQLVGAEKFDKNFVVTEKQVNAPKPEQQPNVPVSNKPEKPAKAPKAPKAEKSPKKPKEKKTEEKQQPVQTQQQPVTQAPPPYQMQKPVQPPYQTQQPVTQTPPPIYPPFAPQPPYTTAPPQPQTKTAWQQSAETQQQEPRTQAAPPPRYQPKPPPAAKPPEDFNETQAPALDESALRRTVIRPPQSVKPPEMPPETPPDFNSSTESKIKPPQSVRPPEMPPENPPEPTAATESKIRPPQSVKPPEEPPVEL